MQAAGRRVIPQTGDDRFVATTEEGYVEAFREQDQRISSNGDSHAGLAVTDDHTEPILRRKAKHHSQRTNSRSVSALVMTIAEHDRAPAEGARHQVGNSL